MVKKKSKVDVIREELNEKCQVICICSLTSTLHVTSALIRVLSKLGTVQVISEDKSVKLLSNELLDTFTYDDVSVKVVDSVIMEEDYIDFESYNYTLLITNSDVPTVNIHKYIMLNRRHYFKDQIYEVEKRYVPMISAYNPIVLDKAMKRVEEERIFVNEKLVQLPSFANSEEHLYSLFLDVEQVKELRINSKVANFVVEALHGIEGCTKLHIQELMKAKVI